MGTLFSNDLHEMFDRTRLNRRVLDWLDETFALV
jgi:hypothetical protein